MERVTFNPAIFGGKPIIRAVLVRHATELALGALVTVDAHRVRVREPE